MSEERVTILRMLSEGKITVEETEKLLVALGQSVEENRAYGGAGRRGRMRNGGPIGELIGEIGHEVRRAVGTVQTSEVGHTVRREIDEAMHRVQRMDVGRMVDKVVDQVRDVIDEVVEHSAIGREEAVEEKRWTLDGEGVKAIHASTDSGEVRFAQGRMGEACVVVRKRVKAQSRAEAEELMGQVQVNVLRDGDTIRVDRGHVKAPKGQSIEVSYVIEGPVNADLDLSSVNGHIEVVGSEAAVRGQSTNGNVTVRDVSGPVQLRTQNGNISARIKRLEEGVLGTDNGNVYVRVAEGNGSLTASSTNGGIEVLVPPVFAGRIDARTTNGSVKSSLDMRRVELVKRTQLVGQVGEESDASIRLHTLNGNVRLKAVDDGREEVEVLHGESGANRND
ncbi:MAG: DUF4097 family beta strand repeat-containing protein [Candidatus Latescibacterota bacterium]|nr:DUF4097 family beta strand repeat-containing protein [Candidatus Latescibacterota bacterium]